MLIKSLYNTFLDAVFPVPLAERQVLAMGGKSAWKSLPRAERTPIPIACSVFSYKDERTWRLIWSVKYKKSADGAAIAGYAIYRVLRLFSLAVPRVIVIPMPITSRRRRERGYNQCELIVDEVKKLDVDGRLSFARDLLVRKKHTSRQTLKDRAGRLENAQDIFAVNEAALERMKIYDLYNSGSEEPAENPFKDSLVIVIDDVITTGGTIKDAVETLRRAGFENAWGLSAAH